jgi:hypothetical protein
MTNYTKDAIDFAFENKLSDMQSAIQDAIKSKISDALEVKKFEVAQGMFGVSEAWGDDDEDDDVARADRELARMKAKPIKAAKGVDPEKDMTKLAKKTKEPEEVDEEVEDIQELSKDTLKSYVNKRQWDMGANEKAQKKMDTGLARAETKLKGDQHKLDKNKNGKVDSHDFKLLRKESEELEEKLSVSDGVQAWIKDFVDSDNPKFEGKSKKERTQMALGAFYAAKKGTNEEVEELEELSKKTLGSYIKKASHDDQSVSMRDIGKAEKTLVHPGDATKSIRQREMGYRGYEDDNPREYAGHYKRVKRITKNRSTGIDRAVDRLTKD